MSLKTEYTCDFIGCTETSTVHMQSRFVWVTRHKYCVTYLCKEHDEVMRKKTMALFADNCNLIECVQ